MPLGVAVPIWHQTQGHLATLAHPRRHLVPPLGFAVAALHAPNNLVPLGRPEGNRKVLPWCYSWTVSSRPASPWHISPWYESSWSVSLSAAAAAAVTPPLHGNRCSKSTVSSRHIGAWCSISPGRGDRPGPLSSVGWWPRCCRGWEWGTGRWKQMQRGRRSRKIPFFILWMYRILLLGTETMHTQTGRDLIHFTNPTVTGSRSTTGVVFYVRLQKQSLVSDLCITAHICNYVNN